MERLRIYVDTSVLGGCFDPEFAVWSNGLVRDFRSGRFLPVLSDVTAAEVRGAPEAVRDLHQDLLTLVGTVLPVTSQALAIVAEYEGPSDTGRAVSCGHAAYCSGDPGRSGRACELEL